MPTDAMIKVMGDLRGVLKKSANKVSMAEMEVLKELDAIPSGLVEIGTQKTKARYLCSVDRTGETDSATKWAG